MLLGVGLPKIFLGEVANIIIYLINKSPSPTLNYKSPMKEWSGRLENYKNLKVFGVLTFAHFKKDKLDEKTTRCIFVEYT